MFEAICTALGFFIFLIFALLYFIACSIKAHNERIRQEKLAKEREYQRWAEQAKSEARLQKVREAFSSFPEWPSGVHDEDFQRRKIDRAFDDHSMYIIDYYAPTRTAHIYGSRGIIYAVSPYHCECPSFQKRYNSIFHDYRNKHQLYPCKHIYMLALALRFGFSESVNMVSEYRMISDEEARIVYEKRMKRKEIESIPLNYRIIEYLRNHEPITIAALKREFQDVPPNEVQKAVYKLVAIESISRSRLPDNPDLPCVYSVK